MSVEPASGNRSSGISEQDAAARAADALFLVGTGINIYADIKDKLGSMDDVIRYLHTAKILVSEKDLVS